MENVVKNRFLPVMLAWAVHLYTALGLVAAAGIAVAIVQGSPETFRIAFILMFVATVVDATDGTLARKVRVKEVLPGFDGRRLDDLVDFLTYTFLPLLLIWRAEILPTEMAWVLLIPLLASAYGFCQVSAKTEDGYFLGFPSYWNLVAFYLYVLRPGQWEGTILLVGLALLTFVPSRYLYPTQRGMLNLCTNILAVVWAGLLIWILLGSNWDDTKLTMGKVMTLGSLFFPVYYLSVSWIITLRLWKRRWEMSKPPS